MTKETDFPYCILWFIFEHLVDYVSDEDIVWTDFDEVEWSQQHTLINSIISVGEEFGIEVKKQFALLPNDEIHRHPGFRLVWSGKEENQYFYRVVYIFLLRITDKRGDETRDLFSDYELSELQHAVLERAIKSFLITHGGGNIRIPFQLISTEECVLKLAGQFAPKPRKIVPKDVTVTANGLVETLSRYRRYVEILSNDGDVLCIKINVEFYFWKLHRYHGTDEVCEFVWNEKYDDAGKLTRTLSDFRVLESTKDNPELV
ncbi:MAG: hypothetical protein ABW076_00685 [Candidatus Thiodiazotropha sp.]